MRRDCRSRSSNSVACFNGLENMELYRVQPTVADYSPSLFCQVAGCLALERIKNPLLENREQIIRPRIIPGNGVAMI